MQPPLTEPIPERIGDLLRFNHPLSIRRNATNQTILCRQIKTLDNNQRIEIIVYTVHTEHMEHIDRTERRAHRKPIKCITK